MDMKRYLLLTLAIFGVTVQGMAQLSENKCLRIAVVDMEKVQSDYIFARIMRDTLELMAANAAKIRQEKDREIENCTYNIQQMLNNNEFSNEQQYKDAVAQLEEKRDSRKETEKRLSEKIVKRQEFFLKELQENLDRYLAEYNKRAGYDFILNKAIVLFGNVNSDITSEVITGLNGNYNRK
jgi:Skp family chaperone for outer membrane proteins